MLTSHSQTKNESDRPNTANLNTSLFTKINLFLHCLVSSLDKEQASSQASIFLTSVIQAKVAYN